MTSISELLGYVPQPLQLAITTIGAIVVADKVLSLLQIILNVLLLSGTSVSCCPYPSLADLTLTNLCLE